MEPMELTVGQQFELERMTRTIDATNDVPALRTMAKQLLQAWGCQRAATQWAMRQQNAPQLDHLQMARELFPTAEADPVPPWDDPLM